MLKLLCGEPGSGKTHSITEEAAKLLKTDSGKRILFIVPEQETVKAESRIFSALPPFAPLTVEIDNFSRLADTVFRKVGGISRKHVGKNEKKLCMWRTLGLVSANGRSPASVKAALAMANELTSGGATPEKLASVSDRLSGEKRLSSLLKEYSVITSLYTAFLSELGCDGAREGEMLCAALAKHSVFNGADIYIDGFTSFTGTEYEIISHLLDQADNVTITLGGDYDRSDIWLAEIRDTAARLSSIAERRGIRPEKQVLIGNKRTSDAALNKLSGELWKHNTAKFSSMPQSVRLVCCRTPLEEAEYVANDIARLVREGARYSDIAVIARNVDDWKGIADTVLKEHGIPAFISDGFRLDDHPAVRFVIRGINSAIRFGREDIASLLKTGCTDLSPNDCDIYIKYANTWKIARGDFANDKDWDMDPDGFVDYESEKDRERKAKILSSVNRVRKVLRDILLPLSEALKGKTDVRSAAKAVFVFLESAKLKDRLVQEAEQALTAGDFRASNEAAGVWNTILKTLDCAVIAAGEEEVTADEFPGLMQLLFDDTEISAIPTSADAVTVGSADMLRSDTVKYVYMIGACEGEFPAQIKAKNLLSGREEKLLEAEGIKLFKDTGILASRELYIFRRAISYASHAVTVTRHSKNLKCEECAPSSAYMSISRLFPKPESAESHFLPEDVLTSVWDKRGAELALNLQKDPTVIKAVENASLKNKVICKTHDFLLSRETCDMLFGDTLNLTQSRLEDYAKCRFRYLCRYILGLRADAVAEFSSRETGTYIHAVLEKIIPLIKTEDLSEEKLKKEIDGISAEYFESVCPERSKDDNRLRAQLSRMKEAVYPIAEQLAKELKNTKFIPIGSEISISDTGRGLPRPFTVSMDGGKTLRLFGKVDRADSLRTDSGVYLRVIDYKTNDKAFRLKDVDDGINLQLLIYLFALSDRRSSDFAQRAGCRPGEELHPGGMLYCVTKPPETKVDAPPTKEEYDALLQDSASVRGVLMDNADVISAMSENVTKGFKPNEGGKDSERMLLSEEEYNSLKEKTLKKLSDMASGMCGGDMRTVSESGSTKDTCVFCDYYNVCRTKNERSKH